MKTATDPMTKIERALVASLGDEFTDRSLFFRAKAGGLERYLSDPAAIAAWQHFSEAGEFDRLTFEEQHPEHTVALALAQEIGINRYHLDRWTEALRERWAARTLRNAMEEATGMRTREALEHLDATREEIQATAPEGDAEEEIAAGLAEIDARAAGRTPETLLTWGIDWMDRRLGRISSHEMVIVGARPGAGKSALLAQVLLAMRNAGKSVSIFSHEMGRKEILFRMAAQETGISISALGPLHPDRNRRFREAYHKIAQDTGIHWHFAQSTIDQILAAAALDVKGREATAVFIDYLQLIEAPKTGTRRLEQITAITRRLKQFAMRHKAPVLVASQLNRLTDTESRPPRLSDLRESGSIEQDADRVLLLHRDKAKDLDQIIQGKNRAGPRTVINVKFDEALTRFSAV